MAVGATLRFLGGGRKPLQLLGHEIHHVIGEALGADAIHVPLPGPRDRVEREQSLFGQRREELDHEERISAGLLLHQLRQGPHTPQLAMHGIGDELADIVESERRQHDLLDPRSGFADRLQRAQKRVRGTDLVVPVGADQQQVPHVRVRDQVLEEVEGRCVEPLQIVEEQRQGMFRPREYVDEASEHQPEPILGVLWWKIRNRWLRADDELQFRDELDNEQPIRVQRLPKMVAPTLKLGLASTQQPADETLKGLRQCGVRDVALVLVEFARCKQATRRDQHLVELVDDGRFSDPGISGNEHQFRGTTCHDSIESGEQGVDLTGSSIQLLRDQQPI